ncbi:hypothetical protein OXX80_008018, partial [Metschnikowia pulcherrima]
MFRSSKSSSRLDIAEIFHHQSDLIRNKRSVRICLHDFSPTTTLADVCETLCMILTQHNPPIHLERIYAAENQISQLPDEFLQLCGPHLRTLDLHRNSLASVPPNLAQRCPNLESLDLSNNEIVRIDDSSLLPFKVLKTLSLKDNQITHLPPILGEMISLENLAISGNPLVFPSLDQLNDMPNINDLKSFLVSNSASLDPKGAKPGIKSTAQFSAPQRQEDPFTPSLARTRSLSDTRSRSSKASRRMGLIINSSKVTPDKPSDSSSGDANNTPSKPARKLSLPNREKSDFAALVSEGRETPFLPDMTPLVSTYTTSTAPEVQVSASPPEPNSRLDPGVPQPKSKSPLAIKEKEQSLDEHDADQKPVAYFRRLSVLQEKPLDETSISDTQPSLEMSGSLQLPAGSVQKQEVSPLKYQAKRKVSNAQQFAQQNSQSSGQRGVVHEKAVIVKVSRKILFSFSELHLSIKRFAGFCGDKKLSSKILRLIHSSKEHIDDLVEAMEAVEDGAESQNVVVDSLHGCINSFKTILATISENFSALVAKIDPCFIRMVLLTLFGSLHELQNAHGLLNQSSSKLQPSLSRNPSSLSSSAVDLKAKYSQSSHVVMENISLETPSISSASEAVATLEEIDERLYQTISLATNNAQVVFSELTKTISKSAIATANTNGPQSIGPAVAAKFKELTHVCMTSMDITRRLVAKLGAIRPNQDAATRRSFWDEINLFLKAVIQTFSAVKDIMRDAPIFNEVRRSMANLTKTTKELTIILEASSYKAISDAVGASPNNNMWHMSNGPPAAANNGHVGLPTKGSQLSLHSQNGATLPNSQAMPNSQNSQNSQMSQNASIAAVRTPLVATVGTAAAQALLAQQDTQYKQSRENREKTHLPPLNLPPNLPPSVNTDMSNSGLHTAPVQSMEQYYAKNVNPFD